MSLITCRECRQQISTQARRCPHCGAPFPGNREWNGSGIDWKTETEWMGYPLIHVAFGRDKNGKLRVAKGIIAIGQFAVGLIAFAQFGIGILFGFGQVILGFTALAQVAIALYFGIGQLATGYTAIGQLVIGYYGLGQTGLANHLWSTVRRDPEALAHFQMLAEKIGLHANHWLNRR